MTTPPKRDTVLDFRKHIHQSVTVKFSGGREIEGLLRGYDSLLNFVLDDAKEYLRDPKDPYQLLSETRSLGRVVCRGGGVLTVIPTGGMSVLEKNPFISDDSSSTPQDEVTD